MARTKATGPKFDYDFIVQHTDWDEVLEKLGIERVIEVFGAKKFFKKMDVDWLLAHVPPEELKKLKERLH